MISKLLNLLFKPPSQQTFAQLMQAALKKCGSAPQWTFDEQEFTLKAKDSQLFLGNVYAEYCAARRGNRALILRRFAESTLQFNQQEITWAEAMESCVAVVRERTLFSFLPLIQQDSDQMPIVAAQEPISDWYCRGIVLDSPTAMRIVTEKDLQDCDMKFEDLFAKGLERLRDFSPMKVRHENGYHVGDWSDDYDSSRLLLPEFFAALKLDGDPVIVTPNRLTIMVAGSNSTDAIASMLQKADEIIRTVPRGENPAPLILQGGKLKDFRVPRDSPLFAAVENARVLTEARYYGQQAQHLERLHQKTGQKTFVADYRVAEKMGLLESCCVWSEGVSILLPKTDMIFFHHPEMQITGIAPWAAAVQVMGSAIQDAGLFPSRWRVTSFPTTEQFQVMGAGPA